MTVPGQSEAIPITPDEIIDSAVGAHEAGATIVHLHVREPETGKPSSDIGLFREVVSGIKDRCDVIVQPTTGGGKGMTLEERGAVLPELEPEMATFNTGSFNFVLGVMGANAATIEQLMHMRRTATELFGEDYTWSAAGVGYPAEYHLAAMCLMLGGHVRVGLEDNLRVSREKRAESNAELVEKAVALGEMFDREPATPDEAREAFGLKGRAEVAF